MKSYTIRLRIILLFIIAGLATIPMPSSHAGNEIKVTYNKNRIEFQKQPFAKNGTTFVETRPFLKPLGVRVDWVTKTKFKLTKADLVIDMQVNSKTAYLNNNKLVTLAAAPLLDGSTLFLPLRPVASLMGLNLNWTTTSNTIEITGQPGNNVTPTPPTNSYKVVAYYPHWATYQNFKVSQIAASNLTHINYAFANVKEGVVVNGDYWADQVNFPQLKQLKQANPKLKTLISIGGWTWSGQFSDIALTDDARKRFAVSAVQFMRNNGFDGIDLDWEYPVAGGLATNRARAVDKTNFTLLLQTLRQKLNDAQTQDGKTYLLTIAAGAFPAYVTNTEMPKVAASVDWINLMTYDYHGNWENRSNHNAPLYADSADPNNAKSSINDTVATYLNAKVPANKLVLGIPMYGRSWTSCGETNQGLYQACKGVAPGVIADGIHEYGNLEKQGWINGNGFVRYWNESAKVPWLYKKSTGTFVSYEDPESIAYKAGYIKSKGLGGAMLWELSQDFNQTLLDKLTNSLR
ncbi:glycosyl hydrolase family 18 protein [Cohnella herbarum]|uniref:chitinase n=1 Tax=Cohnella herbarum TaxID=2728023 RepID=A0A7Z2VR24_9BACL|nr:glycosyl hydrolase family 18 protein [Cohnella herbarum]QJD87639.1 chitinase [Cohnella herbarum]